MKITPIIIFLVITSFTSPSQAINCIEEMNYHIDYSYGYDITCKALDAVNLDELTNITVYNEIKLEITASDLRSIDAKTFHKLQRLRQIVISNCKVNLTSWEVKHVFSDLKHLSNLYLAYSGVVRLPKNLLRGLHNLKIINLEHNQLSSIFNTTFEDIRGLDQLILDNNNFSSLANIPFCEIATITRLSLRTNSLKTLTRYLDCLHSLKHLHLDYNEITSVDSLLHLQILEELTLSNNYIENVTKAFDGLKNLKIINLQNNRIKLIEASTFNSLTNLEKIFMGHNYINNIFQDTFKTNRKLTLIDCENNEIARAAIINLPNLLELNLSRNKLVPNFLDEIYDHPKLLILKIQNCFINNIKGYMFQNFTSLKALDLSDNNSTLNYFSFYGLFDLQELYFSNNNLYDLPYFAFKFTTNLKTLDVSYNNLKKIRVEVFQSLENLQYLNLSHNGLEKLEENVLDSLRDLKVLDVEANKLQDIDYDLILSDKLNLKLFNIKDNQFSCDFLTKMVSYFNHTHVNFTVSDRLEYGEENVGGIHCEEYSRLQSENEMLANDTIILNKLYKIATNDTSAGISVILPLVLLILIIVSLGIAYKVYGFIKRRRYDNNFELLYRETSTSTS